MKINHKEKEEQLKIEKQLIEEFKEGEIICDDYNIKDSKRFDFLTKEYKAFLFDDKYDEISGLSEKEDKIIVKRNTGNPFDWDIKEIIK